MSKQDKYTKSARGQECQVRLVGVCNFNPETTVLAHLNGAGMALKHLNIHGSYCCSSCHNALDGKYNTEYSINELKLAHYDGVIRTQKIMIDAGLLKL